MTECTDGPDMNPIRIPGSANPGNLEEPSEREMPKKMLDMKRRICQLLEWNEMQKYERARDELMKLRESIEKDSFTVAVVGEFSRGKSTFVNALIRQDILPMDVLPETAVLQVVEYAPEMTIELVRKDGRREPVAKANLERFSVDGSEARREDIACLQIGCPSYLLKNRIVLIDTPGVMDMEDQRADITYGVLPQVDMVLFLLDATSPLKKTEYEFITKQILPQGITSIVFLANKVDNVDEEEDEDFLERLQKRLEEAFLAKEGKPGLPEIRLFPLSAKNALNAFKAQDNEMLEASGILALERYLFAALQSEQRDETLFCRFRWKYEQICKRLSGEIAMERNLKMSSAEELEAALQQIEQLMQDHDDHARQICNYVEEQLAVINRMVEKSLIFSHKRLSEEVETAVMDYRGTDFQYFVETQLAHRIQREIDAWLHINAQRIDILLHTVEDELAKGLARNFNDTLHMQHVYPAFCSAENSEKQYIIELAANDISDTDVVAGALTAVGGIGIGLLVSNIFLPFLSLAALPIIRRSLLAHRLAQAQQEALPIIEESLVACYTQIWEDLQKNIAKQGAKIAERFDKIYQDKLEEIKRQVEEERDEKENQYEATISEVKRCDERRAFIRGLAY